MPSGPPAPPGDAAKAKVRRRGPGRGVLGWLRPPGAEESFWDHERLDTPLHGVPSGRAVSTTGETFGLERTLYLKALSTRFSTAVAIRSSPASTDTAASGSRSSKSTSRRQRWTIRLTALSTGVLRSGRNEHDRRARRTTRRSSWSLLSATRCRL